MGGPIVLDVRGTREAKALLEQFTGRQLSNRARRSLRRGAKVFREGLRSEAGRRSDLPRTFRKTRTRAHRNPLGVSVSPKSPLSTIFERGADQHSVGQSGQLLANAGRNGGRPFLARGPVSHPGMAERPFIRPVFERTERQAGEAVADELFEGIR